MYKINYTDGKNPREATDLTAAYTAIEAEFPGCHIEDCGDRCLVWASEEDSINDDGTNAVAEIREVINA